MNFFKILKKSATTVASSYRLIITMWIITLLMVLLVAVPLKNTLKAIFAGSLATERLLDGFDAGLIADMGPAFGNLVGAAVSGGFMLVVAGFFLYTFFSGGLFTRFTTAYGDFKVSAFMKASVVNFPSFLMIALLMCLLTGIWTMVIIGIPVGILMALSDGTMPETKLMIIFYILWGLGIPVWLLVADYSRRWISATGSHKVFRALGVGFSTLKKRFLLSYGAVLTVIIFNIVFYFAALWFATVSVPVKGGMIFLFFLATQMLFMMRLFMKAWRYATVSELALLPGQ